jgi:hypothetical protein
VPVELKRTETNRRVIYETEPYERVCNHIRPLQCEHTQNCHGTEREAQKLVKKNSEHEPKNSFWPQKALRT